MTSPFLTTLVLIAALFALSDAALSVHSLGTLTASTAHSRLTDEMYSADLSAQRAAGREDVQVERADVSKYDVFGLADVQSAVERVFLANGASFATHAHPRGSETVYVEAGSLLSSLRFEGIAEQRVVRLTLSRGDVTVVPQGLPHSFTCASDAGCTYVSFWNTADPGLTAAPAFF